MESVGRRLCVALLVSLLSGGVVSKGSAQTPDEELSARISQGAEIYSRNCQRCHNLRGAREWTDRQWIIILQHMETRANLTHRRTMLVRDFLLASNRSARRSGGEQPELAPVPSPDAISEAMIANGRTVFQGRGGCSACHGMELQGSPVAPNLRDSQWKNGDGSLAAILEIVRDGVDGTAMIAYPGGITDEMAIQAAAYVWSVSQGKVNP